MHERQGLKCAVNAEVGREVEYRIGRVEQPKRITQSCWPVERWLMTSCAKSLRPRSLKSTWLGIVSSLETFRALFTREQQSLGGLDGG